MSQNIQQVLVSSLLVLFACGFSACAVKTEMPKVKMPAKPQFPKSLETSDFVISCDKKNSEMPKVESDVLRDKIVIEDQIENQDFEITDCDNKVTRKGHGPVKSLDQRVTIDPPADLSEKVSYVSIENFRTCATLTVDSLKDAKTFDQYYPYTRVLENGQIRVNFSDSDIKMNLYSNVRDGANVLKIRYFGKCKKLGPKTTSSEAHNCLEPHEIASKDQYLDVRVNRPEISGIRTEKVCPADGTPVL